VSLALLEFAAAFEGCCELATPMIFVARIRT